MNDAMVTIRLIQNPHLATLEVRAFTAVFASPLSEMARPDWLSALLQTSAPAPVASSDAIRGEIRNVLRAGGFKPTGRSKPSSEYLLRAASDQQLGVINPAVDAGNAVSLHSGMPISVVDMERLSEPLSIAIAPSGSQYVFNASGQIIDVGGLACLMDAQGPCANAVKDAQHLLR
jgi:DNA/RNA-binding domain of Phe-tRNA-synthetase-like protein